MATVMVGKHLPLTLVKSRVRDNIKQIIIEGIKYTGLVIPNLSSI